MAIPFKSPISIDTIVPSSMESTTKLTLGAYSIKLQSGTNTSIAINGSSTGSLTLTSPYIKISDDNDTIILEHSGNQNLYGDRNTRTVLEGYPFYIAWEGNDDVLAFDDNGITLGNSVKNTNIKGNVLTINSPNIKLNQGTNINLDGHLLTIGGPVRILGMTTLPNNSRLYTGENRTSSLNLACLKDFNNTVMIRQSDNYIWNSIKPVIFIIPNSGSQTTLYYNDGQDDTDLYTTITDNKNPDYTIGVWAFRNGNNIIVLNIGKESIKFSQFENINHTVGWKSNLGFQYFINDTFPGVTS